MALSLRTLSPMTGRIAVARRLRAETPCPWPSFLRVPGTGTDFSNWGTGSACHCMHGAGGAHARRGCDGASMRGAAAGTAACAAGVPLSAACCARVSRGPVQASYTEVVKRGTVVLRQRETDVQQLPVVDVAEW